MMKAIAIMVLVAVLLAVSVFLAWLAAEDSKRPKSQESSGKTEKSEDDERMLWYPPYEGWMFRDPFSLYP